MANTYVVDEKGEPLLDDNQKPIFKEVIEMRLNGAEIKLWYNCGKDLLTEGAVPDPEVDSVMHLLDVLAENHRNSRARYTVQLPVNYVVGGWHVINSCRKFGIYSKLKDLDRRVDTLAVKIAGYVDAFQKLKHTDVAMNKRPFQVENHKRNITLAVEDKTVE